MSKYVKNLIADDIRQRLGGVQDALLVNLVGMQGTAATRLRAELRKKNIQVLVVKNSMARRAFAESPLSSMMTDVAGTSAVCWGSEDIVSLSKEIVALLKDPQYAPFVTRGGVLDGEAISADQVEKVSKWPSRAEQLSLLLGQILSPGAKLVSQLTSVGGALASQISQKAEGAEDAEAAPAAEAPAAEAAAASAPAEGAGEAAPASEAPPA